MFLFAIAALALSGALVDDPVVAVAAPVTPTATVPAQTGEKMKAKRYCAKSSLTGSRLANRTCRTQEEWARDGVDVTKFK